VAPVSGAVRTPRCRAGATSTSRVSGSTHSGGGGAAAGGEARRALVWACGGAEGKARAGTASSAGREEDERS
jgi:hypothetical protein